MSIMTAVQRGDLPKQMLPMAAQLAAIVHGDGGPEDVTEVLAGLDETQKTALIVALAGMVDMERPVGKGLSWLDVTRHGALPVQAWVEQRPLRDHVPALELEDDDDTFIDQVAVDKYIQGKTSVVTPRERLEAIRKAALKGISYLDLDAMHGLRPNSTSTFVSRTRKKYEARGEEFPQIVRPQAPRSFSEAEVIEIRERVADGAAMLEVAISFDVVKATIRDICLGRSYVQYGGPIRTGQSAERLKVSRDHMCGHGSNSLAARTKSEMAQVA